MSRTDKFADFLEVVGFDNAPFAWHLSGVDVEDHSIIVDALRGTRS